MRASTAWRSYLPASRIGYIKGKVERNAAWALVVASDCAASVSVYAVHHGRGSAAISAQELLAVTGAARMVRFTALGVLALIFGRGILKWAQSEPVQIALIGLIVLCTAGSMVSVIGWIRRSRRPALVK